MSSSRFKIETDTSPNFWKGRSGYAPIAIVNHITAGLMPGCLSWLKNPNSKASSNYLVTRTGRILQLVKDEDTAWANGGVHKPDWPLLKVGVNPNKLTISIEHEGLPHEPLTEAQYEATLWLHRQLIEKWNIPIHKDYIIGHYRIDSVNKKNCPGPKFPWERLFADLRGEVIDTALEKWMIEGGQSAIKELEKKGLLMNASKWEDEKELEKPFLSYLAWIMLNRLADYQNKGGK